MKEFILHIAQSAICLTLFVLVYTLFLRRTTFFKFNRFFLLIGIITSIVLPFFHFSYDVHIPYYETGQSVSVQPIEATDSYSSWQLAFIVYLAGIAILIFRNIKMFWRLEKLRKTGVVSKNNKYQLIDNQEIKTPFSVLKHIYINTENIEDREKGVILKHEISHIEQKHWIDLICGECALMLQWFNPLMWYYVYLQKENHEYLADQAVLENGESIAIYQAVLINQRFQGPVFSFANSFNYLSKKNRLTMMKKTKTSPWKKIVVLALAPLFGGFFALSAKPNYVTQDDTRQAVTITVKDDKPLSLKSKEEQPLIILDGAKITNEQMSNINASTIEKVDVLKGNEAIQLYGESAKNGVIIITTKK